MANRSKKNRLNFSLNFKARNWSLEARSWRLGRLSGSSRGEGATPRIPGTRDESGVGVPKALALKNQETEETRNLKSQTLVYQKLEAESFEVDRRHARSAYGTVADILYIIYYILYIIYYIIYIIYHLLYIIYYAFYFMYYILYILHIIYYILHIIFYITYDI